MVSIRQKLVAATQAAKITNGKNNAKKYIVVHETDNTSVGADADAHARLQINGNSRNASWHWQVDDQVYNLLNIIGNAGELERI